MQTRVKELGDIFVQRLVIFVEQILPFLFRAASAVAFAGWALQRIVQELFRIVENCADLCKIVTVCGSASVTVFAAGWGLDE